MFKKYKGQMGLTIVAIIWGSGFVASAIAIQHYSPYQTLALRFLLAAILLCLIFFKKIKKIKKSTWMRGGILGGAVYLAFLFQTVGLAYTTPSKNAFLTAVNVVIVPILGFLFYKQKFSLQMVLGAVLSLFGIGFLSLHGFNGVNGGDILTLVCAVFFALQITLTNQFIKNEDPAQLTLVQMVTAAIIGAGVCFIRGETLFSSSVEGNLSIFYLGAISTMLAFLIQTVSQKYTTSTETALILSTEAFFGMMASVIILKEPITIQMMIGAILIFSGILIVEVKPSIIMRKAKEESCE